MHPEYLSLILIALVIVGALGFGWTLVHRSLRGWARIALVLSMVTMAVGAVGISERILGHARPVAWEYVETADAEVLYARLEQGRAIYLLLAGPDGPRYYRLPRSDDRAQELREAMKQSRDNQTPLMFRFEPSLDDREPLFYALPPETLPDKPPPQRGREYKAPEWDM